MLIGSYFIDSVQKLGGCPMIVRADMGTENTVVCELQRFLREDGEDSFQGDKSFLYGKSSCNQRIECWWGMLRKECVDFWIDMFKKLRDDGDFDGTFADQNLILFCFLHIVQVCKSLSPTFVSYQLFHVYILLIFFIFIYLFFFFFLFFFYFLFFFEGGGELIVHNCYSNKQIIILNITRTVTNCRIPPHSAL